MMTDNSPDTSHVMDWLPRPVLLLVVARAVNQLGAFSLPFLAVLLVTQRGASLGAAGLVVAVFGAATIPSRLAGGRLTQAIGARRTMVLGLLACAAAQLAIAAAPGLRTTLVAVAVLGLAFEIYEPASQSLVADLSAPEHRPRTFGVLGAALSLGGLLGGLLATAVGGLDLRLLFAVDAATCLVCAVVVRLGLPGGRTTPTHQDRTGPAVRPWRDRRLLVMLAAGTGFATLYLQLVITLPLTLVARAIPVERYGLVLALSALVVVAAQPVLGSRRLPEDPFTVMAIGYVVLAVGLGLTAYVGSLAGFLVATVVWALGDVLLLGHPFVVVAGLAPAGTSARYLAVYGTCWGLAGVLAPLAGTAVLVAAGPGVLWTGCAVLALVLAGLQPAVRRAVLRSDESRAARTNSSANPRRRRPRSRRMVG
ncbi:MAG: MFS transporter [Nocardioides sp.]|nr:MFS transporter [Nocardioides sp.]